jgi:hypothetical protein
MASQLEIDVRALSYPVTAVIHRLHETDPAWWSDFPDEIRSARTATAAHVLDRALVIVEHALKPQPAMASHGQ